MRLLKVPTKLFINPSSADKDVIDNISMVDLESDNAFDDANKDTDGFFTSQWYVAQNKQGTVPRLQQKETDIAKLPTALEMHLHLAQILKHGHIPKAIEAFTQSIRYMLEITTLIISM